jgi:Transposase DDE domain
MRQPTPFFAAFGSLLFGRAHRSKIDALLGPHPAERSLNQFQSAFGEFIPKALLAPQDSGVNSRQRIFSTVVTFWAFLAQVLERGSSCRDALRRVLAWWQFQCPRQAQPSPDTSAYCQARARLEDATLLKIGTHLADQMQRNTPCADLWKGRRVKVIDGTTGSMPDTPKNQQQWPQPKSQQPGCGFPLLKLVGLFCLASGALLQTVHSSLRQHEAVLARLLWKLLEIGDILLADRGFCSFLDLHALGQLGVDAVMRLHQARRADFRQGRRLAKDDRLVTWVKPARRSAVWTQEEFDALPATLLVRILRYRIAVPGFRSQEVILVTTLLDPKAYPLEALAELYFQRWGVELHFREIKTLLGMDVLRCHSPKMIVKELAMHQIAYNLVRALMQRAAICHHLRLAQLSFKGTLDSLHHFADAIHARTGHPRKQAHLLAQLLLTIALDQLPSRPSRSEPRAKKRRPKNYHLLTKPRHQMRVPPHRNRPETGLS